MKKLGVHQNGENPARTVPGGQRSIRPDSPGTAFSPEKPTVLGDAVKGTLRYGGERIHRKLHGPVSEAEHDNAALKTAHKAERIGEAAVRSEIQKGMQMARSHLKKMGDEGKKENRNISNKPAANLAVARTAAIDDQSVNLGKDGAAADAFPHKIAKANATLQSRQPSPQSSKTPLRFDSPHDAQPESRLRFSSNDRPAPSSTFQRTMKTPVSELGTSVDFGPRQPGVLSRGIHKGVETGKRGLRFGKKQAAIKIRGKLEQESGDNSAFKALDEAEQIAERPTKYILKKGTHAAAQPVRNAANKMRNAVRHKFLIRKQAFLAKHKSIAQTRGVAMKARALIKELMLKSKPVMVALIVCLMIYFICTMVVGPITDIVSQAGAEYLITTTYPVANQDITGSTVQWTELEVQLQQRIDDIETEFPDFDEYRYDVDPVEHPPSSGRCAADSAWPARPPILQTGKSKHPTWRTTTVWNCAITSLVSRKDRRSRWKNTLHIVRKPDSSALRHPLK